MQSRRSYFFPLLLVIFIQNMASNNRYNLTNIWKGLMKGENVCIFDCFLIIRMELAFSLAVDAIISNLRLS